MPWLFILKEWASCLLHTRKYWWPIGWLAIPHYDLGLCLSTIQLFIAWTSPCEFHGASILGLLQIPLVPDTASRLSASFLWLLGKWWLMETKVKGLCSLAGSLLVCCRWNTLNICRASRSVLSLAHLAFFRKQVPSHWVKQAQKWVALRCEWKWGLMAEAAVGTSTTHVCWGNTFLLLKSPPPPSPPPQEDKHGRWEGNKNAEPSCPSSLVAILIWIHFLFRESSWAGLAGTGSNLSGFLFCQSATAWITSKSTITQTLWNPSETYPKGTLVFLSKTKSFYLSREDVLTSAMSWVNARASPQ